MNLYDYLTTNQGDYDTIDKKFDACVTVCYMDEENNSYDRFCNGIIKKVELIKKANNCFLLVDWSQLIKSNMDKFRAFTKEYWEKTYENDEDEFIFQWIREINHYMAGYVPEEFYVKLEEFVSTLEA